MIKLIVSDFDGTLIPLKEAYINGMSEKVRDEVLEAMTHKTVVIATGRHPSFIPKIVRDIQFEYIIGFSGNLIFEKDRKRYTEYTLTEIEMFYHFCMSHYDIVSLFMCSADNDFYYTDKASFAYRRKIKSLNRNKPQDLHEIKEKTISEYLSDPERDDICRICFSFEHKENLKRVKDIFYNTFQGYELVQTGEVQYEIMREGINKASAIRTLMQDLNIREDEVAVIGDSYNDVPMFQAFKNSYCIRNDTFPVLDYARYVIEDVSEALQMINKR